MNEISSGEIPFEISNPLIKEYESLITTFKEELDCYKGEQNHLRDESAILLEENKVLVNYIKTNLQKFEESEYKCQFSESDLIKNLEAQIGYLLKEKESTTALWKNALDTIDHLESEQRLHEGLTHGYVSKDDVAKIKQDQQKQIKLLEMEAMRSKIQLLEYQKSTKSIVDMKTGELKQLNENHQETIKAVENLQNSIRQLQLENESLQLEKNKLSEVLKERDKIISCLRKKEKVSQLKVSEAIEIVEAALIEKDAALLRERHTKEDVDRRTKAFSDAMEEASKKSQAELDLAKQQYLEKAEKLKTDMTNLTTFLRQKDLELENQRNATKHLEEKLDIVSKGNLCIEDSNTSKLLILEKNLETTFQKLLLSEKKNIQLEAEKTSIKEDLDQMANMYDRDIRTRESEKRVMENRITALQNDLDSSNSGLMQVASKVEEVNSKLLLVETELKKQLHLKDIKNEKILSNRIKEIEITNSKLNHSLKKRLESQIQFNRKWKVTVNDIVEKLEKKVNDLKQEGHSLKQINKELTMNLKKSEEQLVTYKERLKSLCLDVTKVASFSKEYLTEKQCNEKLTFS